MSRANETIISKVCAEALQSQIESLSDEMAGDLFRMLESHLEDQPYCVECSVCGEELVCKSTRVDSDLDMILKIEPCENCMEEANESKG